MLEVIVAEPEKTNAETMRQENSSLSVGPPAELDLTSRYVQKENQRLNRSPTRSSVASSKPSRPRRNYYTCVKCHRLSDTPNICPICYTGLMSEGSISHSACTGLNILEPRSDDNMKWLERQKRKAVERMERTGAKSVHDTHMSYHDSRGWELEDPKVERKTAEVTQKDLESFPSFMPAPTIDPITKRTQTNIRESSYMKNGGYNTVMIGPRACNALVGGRVIPPPPSRGSTPQQRDGALPLTTGLDGKDIILKSRPPSRGQQATGADDASSRPGTQQSTRPSTSTSNASTDYGVISLYQREYGFKHDYRDKPVNKTFHFMRDNNTIFNEMAAKYGPFMRTDKGAPAWEY